jgi:hypothetical protein
MRQNFFLISCSSLIFITACRNNYGDEFYGTYTNDRFEASSRLTFYNNNTYSFHFSGSLSNQDSGTIELHNDTICFTSFFTKRDESDQKNNKQYQRTLTGKKFNYQKNRILYFNCPASLDKLSCDTICWKKQLNTQQTKL